MLPSRRIRYCCCWFTACTIPPNWPSTVWSFTSDPTFIFYISQKNRYKCTASRKKRPPPQVKYSNTHNTEQKSLKITENTLTSIWTLCAKLQVSSVSGWWYYYLLSATHQKCNFPNETISVKSNEQSAKKSRIQNAVQNVHRQRSHTLAVEYATDNHAVLIKWKVRQCWRQSEQYWRQ